jgi:hypothetical protein
MKTYKKFLENAVTSTEKVYDVDLSKFTIVDNKVKLWHYSSVKITDGIISISKPHNIYSNSEYSEWNKSRSFFYATNNGVLYDKGVQSAYEYVCYIDVNKIYDINKNACIITPDRKLGFSAGSYEELYKLTSDVGFAAWTYNLAANENVPIVISFEDLKISESYMKTAGGERVPFDWIPQDYIVGNIKMNDQIFDVYQKDGFSLNLTNLYYNPEPNNKGYKRRLDEYIIKDIIFLPQYKNIYAEQLKI